MLFACWVVNAVAVAGYFPIAGLIFRATKKLTRGFAGADGLLATLVLGPPLCALCAMLILVIGTANRADRGWQGWSLWALCIFGAILGWPLSWIVAALSTDGVPWAIRC